MLFFFFSGGGLEHVLFFHILARIIPTDFHIFQMAGNHQPVLFVTPFFWLFNNRLFLNSQRIKDFAERNSGAKAQGEAEPEKVPWQSVG